MKKYIFSIILILCELMAFSQEIYLHTQFVKDKKILEKEAYKELKKSSIYKKDDSLRIVFVYCFKYLYFSEFEIKNNLYLKKVEPHYRYSNYIFPFLFREKFPTKKRLRYDGYVLDKNNKLTAVIGCGIDYPFQFRLYMHSEMHINEYNYMISSMLKEKFDFCFYTYFDNDVIWCVKDNQTFIYQIKTTEMMTLQDYYTKGKYKPLTPQERLGIPH